MSDANVYERVVQILGPFTKDKDALANVSESTNILEDLKVNSARLVDVILQFEDEFGIEIADADVDGIATVGDCVKLIGQKKAA